MKERGRDSHCEMFRRLITSGDSFAEALKQDTSSNARHKAELLLIAGPSEERQRFGKTVLDIRHGSRGASV